MTPEVPVTRLVRRAPRTPHAIAPWCAAALALGSAPALAQVAPECLDFAGPAPEGYDEQAQRDFIANRTALLGTLSPVHGPIPHQPGRAALGVDLAGAPPMGCERRFVADHRRTYDTNRSPVLVRPRFTVALPAIGKLVPYLGVAYAPPVRALGATTVVMSGEIGAGMPIGEHLQLGARLHAGTHRTVADIATPAAEGDPVFEDLFLATTFGADLLAGWAIGAVTPYVAGGVTDVSTFFYVGDDSVVVNNLHPYLGPVFSLGVDALAWDRLRIGAEAYAAPGGYSLPSPDAPTVRPPSRYGQLYTGRLRIAVEL